MQDSQLASDAAAKSEANEPTATYRLVIRAEIIPEETPQNAPSLASPRSLAFIVAGLTALLALIWIGIGVFKSDSTSAAGARHETQSAEQLSQPPLPAARPEAPPTSTKSSAADSTPAPSSIPREAPLAADRQVVPEVPQSALRTIRGTVRVLVRVTIDNEGKVVSATAEDPGPSRYFERLAVAAAQQWTFTRTPASAPRSALLRFNFKREGATAHAELP